MKRILFFLLLPVLAFAQDWATPTEKSGYRITPNYAETMAYIERVAAAAPKQVKVEQFGTTANGYPLNVVIVSKDGKFTPDAAHKANRAVVYIQVHAQLSESSRPSYSEHEEIIEALASHDVAWAGRLGAQHFGHVREHLQRSSGREAAE